jgi:hypothetical protein
MEDHGMAGPENGSLVPPLGGCTRRAGEVVRPCGSSNGGSYLPHLSRFRAIDFHF